MPKYDVSVKMSGFFFRTVEAETREEAEEKAEAEVSASDWNDMEFMETKVMESEEVE